MHLHAVAWASMRPPHWTAFTLDHHMWVDTCSCRSQLAGPSGLYECMLCNAGTTHHDNRVHVACSSLDERLGEARSGHGLADVAGA
jgi:hypothetical protein